MGTKALAVLLSVALATPASSAGDEETLDPSSANLEQIGLALLSYHQNNGHFPAAVSEKDGKPLLSWRVELLPLISQQNIYAGMNRGKPWDSPENKFYSELQLKLFRMPGSNGKPHETPYRVAAGKGTLFEPGKRVRLRDVTDGASNTIMAVEAAEAVPWAKPAPLEYGPKKPLPKLFFDKAGVTRVLMADGSVRLLRKPVKPELLRALLTRNGGEKIPEEFGRIAPGKPSP